METTMTMTMRRRMITRKISIVRKKARKMTIVMKIARRRARKSPRKKTLK